MCSNKQDTLLDLYIIVVGGKFVTGISHKVGGFSFEIINYPFPESNINSILGCTTFYQQLICLFRLCNNVNDFLFWAKLSCSRLVKCGYMHILLFEYFKRFCLTYKKDDKNGKKNYYYPRIWLNTVPLFLVIYNVMGINAIAKTCSLKIRTITSSFKDICINKPPLPPDVFDDVNTPISCINTTALDAIERSRSYSLKDIAKCSTIPCENIPHSVLLGDENLNNTYTSRDTQASCQLIPPFMLNKHIHTLGIGNPNWRCYLTHLLFLIFRTIGHNFQSNSSTEGSLSKCT